MTSSKLREFEAAQMKRLALAEEMQRLRPGQLVRVHWIITERGKQRVQPFEGLVLRVRGGGTGKTFTVRRLCGGIGVERVFPLASPLLQKLEILKQYKVRRAYLSFLRQPKPKRLKRVPLKKKSVLARKARRGKTTRQTSAKKKKSE
jgi:large subunit ribosomal protein L19